MKYNSSKKLWTEWIAGGVEMRFTDLTGLHKKVHEFVEDSRAQKNMVWRETGNFFEISLG